MTTKVLAIVAATAATGLALSGASLVVTGVSWRDPAAAGVLGALLLLAGLRPMLMFRGRQSEAASLEEAVLVIMLLALPAAVTVAVFAVTTAVVQVCRRRPPVKGIFNTGQTVAGVGAALMVQHVVLKMTRGSDILSPMHVGAAVAGVLAFFAVNHALVACVMATAGDSTWWAELTDGLALRFAVVAGCLAVAGAAGIAFADHHWVVWLLPGALLVGRILLAGLFRSRHDRDRLTGVLRELAEISSSGAFPEAICEAATSLLRCSYAVVASVPDARAQLHASSGPGGSGSWLSVWGRPAGEPFDAVDQAIIELLARTVASQQAPAAA